MPNTDKKGGTHRTTKHKQEKLLTEEQAKFVYKRLNARKGINTKIIQQEMVQTKLVETEPDNTYQKAILYHKEHKST